MRSTRHAQRAPAFAARWLARARAWCALLLVASLMFSRLAVAAYLCPAQQAHTPMPMATAAAMPCAEMAAAGQGLDPLQPLLCQQHCQWGQTEQSGSAPGLAAAPMAPAPLWVVLPAAAPVMGLPATGAALAPPQERPPPAPLRTLLCCLRP